MNPNSDMENETNAKLGRAISKLGDRKELDPKEKIYLRTVAATMATALKDFSTEVKNSEA